MTARQRIIPVRRDYNRWVANQTLEDYKRQDHITVWHMAFRQIVQNVTLAEYPCCFDLTHAIRA